MEGMNQVVLHKQVPHLQQVEASPLKLTKLKKRKWVEFLCCVPAVLLIIVLTYYPLAELVRISFTDWNMLKKDYQYVGLKNWEWFFHEASGNRFFASMWITIKYAIGSMAITIIGGILFALLFNRLNLAYSAFRAIVIIPRYVAMSTSAIIFLLIMNENYGVLNYLLSFINIAPVKWLTDGNVALYALIILTGWHSVGYGMLIYLSSMQGVSKEYYESASIDGATGLQSFFKITIPLLAPTTLFLFVTQFIAAMKVYQSVDVLTGGGPYYSTEVIVYLIYNLAYIDYRIDRSAVVSIVFFVFIMVLTLVTLKWSDKKVNYDS